MNKVHLINEIIANLTESPGVLEKAARASHAEATHESSKAESKYDTRGLEAAYLAGGQARQAKEIQDSIKIYQTLTPKKFAADELIDLTALVELDAGHTSSLYFIGPKNGGLEIEHQRNAITVITPQSPLGQNLMGKKAGQSFTSIKTSGTNREMMKRLFIIQTLGKMVGMNKGFCRRSTGRGMRSLKCRDLVFAVVFLTSAITTNAGTLIDVAFTDATMTSKTGFAATGLTTNDFWNTYVESSGALPNLQYVDGTSSGAGLTVDNASDAYGNGASDPMYGVYLFPEYSGSITLTITNLPGGTYDFYLYGHGNENNQNSVFLLDVGSQSYGSEQTTNGAGWLSPTWQEGVQYVEFTNVTVSQSTTITVDPGPGGYAVLSGMQMAAVGPPLSSPYIDIEPVDQPVIEGLTATFSTVASGLVPITYQWLFKGTIVVGATNASYSVTNAQSTNAGYYSVIVNNPNGSVTSAVADLTVILPVAGLIDVAFTSASATSKTGFAATGVTTNDFWNTYVLNSGSLPDLAYVDGTPSKAGLLVTNDYSTYDNGAADPMFGVYLYSRYGGSMTLTVTNLPGGTYDFYLYGHGIENTQNGIFQLVAGTLTCLPVFRLVK